MLAHPRLCETLKNIFWDIEAAPSFANPSYSKNVEPIENDMKKMQ